MRIAVISSFAAGERIDFRREVDLVKAASLYADEVEVLSFSSLVFTEWDAVEPEEATALSDALAGRDLTPMPEVHPRSQRIRADTGINELLPAIGAALVSVNKGLPRTGDVWGAFVAEIVRCLEDPSILALVDTRLSTIVANLIETGRASPSSAATQNATEAVIGAGLISRLPTFTEIPMDELLDLRTDLATPLHRYRSVVAGLRSTDLDPYSHDREAEIDALWRKSVEPELDAIREGLAQHTLIKDLARSLGTDLREILTGAPLRAGLTAVLANALEMNETVSLAAAGTIGLAPTVIQGVRSRGTQRAALQQRDLYYLYRLQRAGETRRPS